MALSTKRLRNPLVISLPSSRLVSHFAIVCSNILTTLQVDLENSEDDIADIQQEISVLSTCSSPYVTQYKASFMRGYKLWIVMEYMGGGSCIEMVLADFTHCSHMIWN